MYYDSPSGRVHLIHKLYKEYRHVPCGVAPLQHTGPSYKGLQYRRFSCGAVTPRSPIQEEV